MVTNNLNQVDQSVSMLEKLETAIRSIESRRDAIQAEMDEINRLGFCDAKPHYRDGKYLYLIHPMVDGERKREYIGADPEKIMDALARIARKDRYEQLEQELGEVNWIMSQVHQHLWSAISAATPKW